MPQDVEVVRSMYAEFSEIAEGRDIVSFVASYFDPDCEYQPVEEIDAIRGHDALVRWHQRWFEAWEEFRADVDEIIDAGEVVFAAITVHGRGGGSGMEITQLFFHVIEVRSSMILRMREYLERDPALEAAGLENE